MREWLNRAVSKTVEPLRVPWVRIPPSPPEWNLSGTFCYLCLRSDKSKCSFSRRGFARVCENFRATCHQARNAVVTSCVQVIALTIKNSSAAEKGYSRISVLGCSECDLQQQRYSDVRMIGGRGPTAEVARSHLLNDLGARANPYREGNIDREAFRLHQPQFGRDGCR